MEYMQGNAVQKREIIHIDSTISQETLKLQVAGYCRVSSDSDDQLNSFASQVSYYTQLIKENPEWELVRVYADEGISGVSMEKREEFNRMIEDCREGKIDKIITKSSSRFARNVLDSVATVRELKSIGVSVIFEKEGIDSSELTDETMLTLYSLFAQEESISLSQNCKKGIQMSMGNGTYVASSPPFGYRLVDKQLTIFPQEAEVVERIFRDYLNGSGCREIANQLTNEGVLNRKGNPTWDIQSVLKMLRNEKYIGDTLMQKSYSEDFLPYTRRTNKGERPQHYIKRTHPPIIGEIPFQLVQLLLQERGARINVDRKITILSSLITCSCCGKHYRRKVTRQGVVWVCRTHENNKDDCPSKPVSEEKIHQAFLRMFNKLQQNRDHILKPMIATLEKLHENEQRGNVILQQLNQEIADLSEQNHMMSGLLSSGILDSALFISKTDEIKKGLKKAKEEKARLLGKIKKDNILAETEELLNALQYAPPYLATMDEEIFTDLVVKIVAYENKTIDFVLKNGLTLKERL